MRRISAFLGLCLPVLAVTACGDGGEVVVATPAAMAAAGQSTIDAGSARMETVMRIDGSSFGVEDPIEMVIAGVQDFEAARSSMTMDMGAILDAAAGAAGDALPEGLGGEVEIFQDGNDMYMCGSFVQLLAQAECLHLNFEEMTGADLGALSGGSGADPSALLASLAGSAGVEEVGPEEVVGVQTTHFAGEITMRESLAAASEESAAAMQDMIENLGYGDEFLDLVIEFDVWIDGDGRVRQMRQQGDLADAGLPGGRYDVEVRFLEFGVPVDFEIPEDFVEASDLPGLGG